MKEKTINTVHVERARHRITQGELAQEVGCSRQTIHAIESGKITPVVTLALKIVRHFNFLNKIKKLGVLKFEDIFKLEKQ